MTKLAIPTGTITIRNIESNEYRTFKVRKFQPADSKFMPGKRIVGLLTGPDNYHDFDSFGSIGDDGMIRVFAKKKNPEWGKRSNYEWFAEMINVLVGGFDGKAFPGYEVLLAKKCCRCGRKLTTPTSIENGIGPECAEMI